jgi:hypothetical protein
MGDVQSGVIFNPKSARDGPSPSNIDPFEHPRFGETALGRSHGKRRVLPWPNSRKSGIVGLVTVLAVATLMLPFLIWFVAPLVLLGVVVAARNSKEPPGNA